MKLAKKVIIPNDEIGMITLTPMKDKIQIENANLGKFEVEANVFDTYIGDLQILTCAIVEDLDECIEEQKDETYEETYQRICND